MAAPGAVVKGRWSKWKRAGVTAAAVITTIAGAAAADFLFHLQPIAAEKFWIAGLQFGVTPLQEEATLRLRNYPTRAAALALVAYIDAKARAGDLKLACRAGETLCLLTGRSFGTAFGEHARGHTWSPPDAGQWPEVLAQIEQWSDRTLGAAR